MRAVVQRVRQARVEVADQIVGHISVGLLVYLGAGKGDGEAEVRFMSDKLLTLRIFEDEQGKMNRSVSDVKGQILVVSQFTLYGDVRSGRRPGFEGAAPASEARARYEAVCSKLAESGLTVATGQFQADMQVYAQVDGPVTILVDSERKF